MEDEAVKRAIGRVIDERTYFPQIGHRHVKKLEEELSKKAGGAPVVAVNSGTDALILAMRALGIGAGDEVIVPAFSFISTASAAAWLGAVPVFADIKEDDYALNPAEVKKNITPRTKAIILVHLFGQPALGTAEILQIAKENSLWVIEDAAQAFAAEIKINGRWQPIGTLADIGCLSFAPSKPFAAPGNGGALIFSPSTASLHDEIDRMRFYGAKRHYYDYPTIGINCKMHEVQAAALLARLPFFDHWLSHRERLAEYYNAYLQDLKDLALPQRYENARAIWYRYIVRTKRRDELFMHLQKKAGSTIALLPEKFYPVLLSSFSAFRRQTPQADSFPVASQLSKETIDLPMSNFISVNDIASVASSILAFYKHNSP